MQYEFAERMQGVSGSAIREIFKLLGRPNIISFGGGMPSAASLPAEEISAIAERLLAQNGAAILQYGTTEGWAPLRESVQGVLAPRGIKAGVENTTILTGSSQGIELMTKLFINPNDTILCENPTFLGALQTFFSYQANVIGIDTHNDGLDIEQLEQLAKEHKPKFLYTIPTFQNPSGVTMSLEKRQKLVQHAEKYDFLILEDDPYCELRYSGDALPAIKSFDTTGRVVHLMSFSKTISPGLRVGACVGDATLIRRLLVAKQGMDTHTANLPQAIVDDYIRTGRYAEHVREILPAYREQLTAMLSALDNYPAGARYTRPEGGLFVWLELPDGKDALELLNKALENNVAYIPGTHFYPAGGHENTLRLNFSASTASQITRGMNTLKDVLYS